MDPSPPTQFHSLSFLCELGPVLRAAGTQTHPRLHGFLATSFSRLEKGGSAQDGAQMYNAYLPTQYVQGPGLHPQYHTRNRKIRGDYDIAPGFSLNLTGLKTVRPAIQLPGPFLSLPLSWVM